MAWYCKECGDLFVFGYSKKYCSEECYDDKEDRKARRRAEARKEELKRNELSALKSSFQDKWGIQYNLSSTDAPKIQELINQEKKLDKKLDKKIKELEALTLESSQ